MTTYVELFTYMFGSSKDVIFSAHNFLGIMNEILFCAVNVLLLSQQVAHNNLALEFTSLNS